MVSKRVKVINPLGLHMRPAQLLLAEMARYDSDVTILFEGKTIDARNIMGLMASCVQMDSEIEICCEGSQEAEALKAAVRLVESGLGDL